MDGRGDVMRFGGQVMKNVAGYDVSRLAVGSMGTLGVILELSIKVLPVPVARATLRLAMGEVEALSKLNEWGGQPLPISASRWCAGDLHVRLEGAGAAVDAARRKIGGETVDDAAATQLWRSACDQTDAFFVQPGVLWRLSVPSTAAPIALPGRQLVEWGGALRWWMTDAGAESVKKAARMAGGNATQFRGGDRSAGVFGALDPVLARLHRKVKAAFDPAGVFNPFRLYPEW
jgi:glycolate oxidase FAD binding subunit